MYELSTQLKAVEQQQCWVTEAEIQKIISIMYTDNHIPKKKKD